MSRLGLAAHGAALRGRNPLSRRIGPCCLMVRRISSYSCSISEVTDGLGKTILLAEDAGRLDESRCWADPYNAFVQEGAVNQSRADEIFSDHPGGAFILFADGNVHFLSETADLLVVNALATRSEGEIIPEAVLPARN